MFKNNTIYKDKVYEFIKVEISGYGLKTDIELHTSLD